MELYERFTDIEYKTPKGVRAALSMSNIDPIWQMIDRYRRQYAKLLDLKTFNASGTYYYVLSPALEEKFSALFRKIEDFNKAYKELDSDILEACQKQCRLDSLSYLCQVKGIKASELTLKAIINKMYRDENSDLSSVKGYLEALEELAYKGVNELDEDYLAKEYEFVCQTNELTSFYRAGRSNEYMVRIQVGTAPESYSDDIPLMMENLVTFANNDPINTILKSLICLYALYAIKPFSDNNAEMAYILAKAVLNKFGQGVASSYLPLENLLIPSDALDDYLGQTMKTRDMTYLLHYSLGMLNNSIDRILDFFTKQKQNLIREEFIAKTKEEELIPTPVETSAAPTQLVEAPVSATPVTMVEASPNPEKEVEKVDFLPSFEGERALSAPKSSLSDKEVKETAKYLRESHPGLSRGQCLFYASHCTLGRYYAINDYKKTIKCAYETARTSMDKLAAEGFYKKLQIKNKFVYTPIKQGENK